jgi:hypothetical protein
MSDPVVVAGLGLLGVPPLPDLRLLDEHIEAVEGAAAYHAELASSGAARFPGEDEGPAADALRVNLTGPSGALYEPADIASRFEAQGGVLRTARGVIDWAGAILAALAVAAGIAAVYFPELLLRLRTMATRIGEMIRAAMRRMGEVFRRLVDGRMSSKIERVAGRMHEHWRSGRTLPDRSGFEPRIKPTTDKRWIKRHGVDQVDIANTQYRDLPADIRRENWQSARHAIKVIREGKRQGVNVHSDTFLESASSDVHDAWLLRNAATATEEQKLPYAALSEVEKAKDRVVVLNALDVVG